MSSSRFGPPGGSRWPNKGQGNNTRSSNGKRWGKPTWGSGSRRPLVVELGLEHMLITQTPFVRGMVVDGCGLETVKPQRMNFGGGASHSGFYNQVGSGTIEDPTVTWLIDPANIDGMDADTLQAHVDIARKVAQDNGFPCIMIRAQSHKARTTRTATGQRQTYRAPDGIERPVILPADPHITAYMGPNPRTAMVEGHIYTHRIRNPKTGYLELKMVDDPATQRNPKNLSKGSKMVAEEFWITKGSYAVVPEPENVPAAQEVQAAEQPERLDAVEEEEPEETQEVEEDVWDAGIAGSLATQPPPLHPDSTHSRSISL